MSTKCLWSKVVHIVTWVVKIGGLHKEEGIKIEDLVFGILNKNRDSKEEENRLANVLR